VTRYIPELSFEHLLNHFILSCVEKVMTLLLRQHRKYPSYKQLCFSSILGAMLWSLGLALWITVLQDFLSFSY